MDTHPQSDMIWLVSRISVFLERSIDTSAEGHAGWTLPDGSSIQLDMVEKEVRFIDFEGDEKTYFAIKGVADSHGFSTGDYDSDDGS